MDVGLVPLLFVSELLSAWLAGGSGLQVAIVLKRLL